MRVANPRFKFGSIGCDDCPLDKMCDGVFLPMPCPRNMDQYTAACLMAEEAAKGGKE